MILRIELPRHLFWTVNDVRGAWQRKSHLVRDLRAIGRLHAMSAIQQGGKVTTPTHLTATIGYPHRRRSDPANLAGGSEKHLLDGIADSGLIPGDDSRYITHHTYTRDPEVTPKDTYRITFEFQDETS